MNKGGGSVVSKVLLRGCWPERLSRVPELGTVVEGTVLYPCIMDFVVAIGRMLVGGILIEGGGGFER